MHCGASHGMAGKKAKILCTGFCEFLVEKIRKHGIVLVEQWKQLCVVLARSE